MGTTGARPVMLWVDTFNNHFHPQTLHAAVEVLECAGFDVVTSPRLCCGRPLYDFGLIDHARRYLERILRALAPQLEAGTPIVVLEPSCASVFRDELRSLFPNDIRATKLRQQTMLLSEFLIKHAPGFAPGLDRQVLLHGHCHHKAIMKMNDQRAVLQKSGTRVESPEAGCCGMAGPFGLMAKSAAVGRAIGEQVLLPAVREASDETLVCADGFSCREQIRQGTGREALHLAEVLRMAIRG